MNNFMFDMSKGFDFLTNGGQQIILNVIFVALPVLLYFYTKQKSIHKSNNIFAQKIVIFNKFIAHSATFVSHSLRNKAKVTAK